MRRPGIFVLVALVVAAVTFFMVDRDEPSGVRGDGGEVIASSPAVPIESPTKTRAPLEKLPPPGPGLDLYQSRAGYAFEYPEEWNLDKRGTAVEIVAPNASVAMSFGIAPEGDVRGGMGDLLDAIESRYAVNEVRGPNSSRVGDADVVSVSGSGVNDDGIPIDFTALVIEGPSRNYAITVFGGENANDTEIRAILDSFQTF